MDAPLPPTAVVAARWAVVAERRRTAEAAVAVQAASVAVEAVPTVAVAEVMSPRRVAAEVMAAVVEAITDAGKLRV